jgi:hypothetical protein
MPRPIEIANASRHLAIAGEKAAGHRRGGDFQSNRRKAFAPGLELAELNPNISGFFSRHAIGLLPDLKVGKLKIMLAGPGGSFSTPKNFLGGNE